MANDRATKKQQELLQFIDGFIKGNGYGPTYREIMRALGYKSVSTVAIHIDQLISKGYLEKRDRSSRSLVVVRTSTGQGDVSRPSVNVDDVVDFLAKRVEALQESPDSQDDAETLSAAISILKPAVEE